MRIGLATDHGGYPFKEAVILNLMHQGHEVIDFGAEYLQPTDDYPDFVAPLARAVASGAVERGLALCGSGVGACITANKIPGVRACLIHENYTAHQAVEHDNLNVLCLGARVIGIESALELITTFVNAQFTGEERHVRRLGKIVKIEQEEVKSSSSKSTNILFS